MLKPKVIAQVLRQALRNGIKASLLMTNEGSLLAFAADNDKNARTYAAIIANVWATYKKQSSADTFLGSDPMGGPRFLLLQCEASFSLGGITL
ncbi:Ragulator complex protein lamtor2 [Apophysomyces sp. BC1015]|nr:Ragulator complex protein lamtor2 [Apophysomyces sp. BC1015]